MFFFSFFSCQALTSPPPPLFARATKKDRFFAVSLGWFSLLVYLNCVLLNERFFQYLFYVYFIYWRYYKVSLTLFVRNVKCPCLHHDNIALIKQISLSETALVITNYIINSKQKKELYTNKKVKTKTLLNLPTSPPPHSIKGYITLIQLG